MFSVVQRGRPFARALAGACAAVAVLLIIPVLPANPGGAQTSVYKWTDESGTVHFSNSAPHPNEGHEVTEKVMRRHVPKEVPKRKGEIPFVFMGGDTSRRFVRVTLEGPRKAKEVLMLVDTGAQVTLIDEELASALDLEHVQDVAIMGVTGTMPGWIGRLRSLRLGDEELKSPTVMVGPRTGMLLLGVDVLDSLKFHIGQKALTREG